MRRISLIFGIAPLLVQGGLAQAQDRLDPITVTTTSLSSGDDGQMGNVTSLQRDDIVENLGANLGDSLLGQPGVSGTQFGPGASRPILRGLGAERVLVLTNGLGVIDASATSPDHQVASDSIDAQRIEILRGRDALAYGGQAVGGVVNVFDGLIGPSEGAGFGAEGLALFDSVNEGETYAARLTNEFGPIRAVVSVSTRDLNDYEIPGFAESAGQRAPEAEEEHHDDDHDDEDHDEEEHEEEAETQGTVENSFAQSMSVSAGLTWSNETTFLGVSIRQQEADYGLIGHSHGHHDHEEEEHEGEEEGHEEHGEEGEEAPFIDLEQTKIEISGGHNFEREEGLTRIDFGLVDGDYTHTEFEAPGEAGTIYDVEGTEARINAHFKTGETKYIVGANYTDVSLSIVGEEAFLPSSTGETFGAFALSKWKGASGHRVNGGVRYENVERRVIDGLSREFNPIGAAVSWSKSYDGDWDIGLQLAYTERAPNENELFSNGEHIATQQFEIGDANLDLEANTSIELTAGKSFGNGRIGGNIYVNDFSNFIYFAPGTSDEADDDLPVVAYTQQDAEFIGFELFSEYRWDDVAFGADLNADIGLDYVSATLNDGADVPYIPPMRLLLGVSADWEVGSVYANFISAAEQDKPGEGHLITDGYNKLDIGGELYFGVFGDSLDKVSLIVKAENLFDEEIRSATSFTKDLAPHPGQNFRIGLKAKF